MIPCFFLFCFLFLFFVFFFVNQVIILFFQGPSIIPAPFFFVWFFFFSKSNDCSHGFVSVNYTSPRQSQFAFKVHFSSWTCTSKLCQSPREPQLAYKSLPIADSCSP